MFNNIIKQWTKIVGSHWRVSETNNTIKTSFSENVTYFLHYFRKILTINFDSSNISVISINFAYQFSSSKLNIQIIAEMFKAWTFGSIILFMILTTVIIASSWVDPNVRTTSVENNFKIISFFSKGYIAYILSVFKVVKLNVIFLLCLNKYKIWRWLKIPLLMYLRIPDCIHRMSSILGFLNSFT